MKARQADRLATGLMWLTALISAAILCFIVAYIVAKGTGAALSWDFFWGAEMAGVDGQGSIRAPIVATVMLMGLTMVILVPLGIGAAVYLAEYAPAGNRFIGIVRRALELLAGVPSVVFGLVGFAILVLAISFGYCVLAGALTLVCLLLPSMVVSVEESIRAVPQSYREGALALGATKWQVVMRVVLPAALPGIVTGIVLCFGRAMSESAPLLMTMGGSSLMPHTPLDPGRPLSVELWYRALYTRAGPETAAAIALVLLLSVLFINLATNWIAGRIKQRFYGAAVASG